MKPVPNRHARDAALILTATACCLIAASCGPLSRPAAERQLYAIDPGGRSAATPPGPPDAARAAAHAAAPAAGPALRVRRLQVVKPYASTAFVYRTAGGAFRTDYYNGFVTPPADLLTGAVIDRLWSAGGFVTVVDSTSAVPARYVLEGSVTALYGDYTDRKAPRAVIGMRLFVLDDQTRGSRLVFQKDYRAAAPIKAGSVPSLVSGWNQALDSILQQVEADLPSRLSPEPTDDAIDRVPALRKTAAHPQEEPRSTHGEPRIEQRSSGGPERAVGVAK